MTRLRKNILMIIGMVMFALMAIGSTEDMDYQDSSSSSTSGTEKAGNTDSETEDSKEESDETEAAYSYSSNGEDTVKNGDSGMYSYKTRGGQYDCYYIVDFDEGYVYYFTEGNGSGIVERVKIDSGDLNNVLIITYHDGNDTWSYGLHFKWQNQPDHLIMQDIYGTEYDYYGTDLSDALELMKDKEVVDY